MLPFFLRVGVLVVGLIGTTGARAADDLYDFAVNLTLRMRMVTLMGTGAPAAYDGGKEDLLAYAAGNVGSRDKYGSPVPAVINGWHPYVTYFNTSRAPSGAARQSLGESIQAGEANAIAVQPKEQLALQLFLTPVTGEHTLPPREALEQHFPVARFGDFGLFMFGKVGSAGAAAALTDVAKRAASARLLQGRTIPGMSVQVGDASELSQLVAGLSSADELAAPNAPPEGNHVAGVRLTKDGQKEIFYAKNAPLPGETAPTSTVGPQIKGYDPREANREPPRGPPPPKPTGRNFVKLGSWTTESDRELERERKAREAQATAAKKPRLTMADYAKKAAQERAEFQVKKAQAAADSKQVLNWLLNDRNTKEADIRQRVQKHREYVDGQASRRDAVMHGEIYTKEGWLMLHLRNRTDVSLDITIDLEIFDQKGERVYVNPRLSVLLPLEEANLTVGSWDPSYVLPVHFEIHWVADPSNYQGNY